ncbi:ParB/RepB/Spo0J family partition protein [Tateyamaria omphalii]|uniref:ParB-like N-terminal domain-containing protein n=1 Tax=Tateyamaria omphalii TaxID=299262 RepID=A0A1P8N239_9RHOB|nr:ParB N-terminal domain-containing protein [Tateyamaria omphalii]APX14372.1 hypothetical protein BWR18_21275 [Tateyamaria omphalii]
MAKRKRLTPARLDQDIPGAAAPETKSMPLPGAAPISQIAGASATASALEDVTAEMQRIRRDGLLVLELDLDVIDAAHLVRDRLAHDTDALEALKQSLIARGQQTPIEVMATETGYGLISGWRRLTALRALYEDTGEARFAQVLALLRQPDTAAEAYVAMVEENEIRVGLSHYERARIVVRAAEQGVFPSEQAALRGLFATASRARRSKIGSFMRLYHALDSLLQHPSAIPERLGLSLVKRLEDDPGTVRHIQGALLMRPPNTAADEIAVLEACLPPTRRVDPPDPPRPSAPRDITVTARIENGRRSLTLTGADVTGAFETALRRWLSRQG